MIGVYEIVMLVLLFFPWSLLLVMSVGAAWTKIRDGHHARRAAGGVAAAGARPDATRSRTNRLDSVFSLR